MGKIDLEPFMIERYVAGLKCQRVAFLDLEADPMADSVDCETCHDLSKPTNIESINAACIDCHDDDEERIGGLLASWSAEIDRLMDALTEILAQMGDPGKE